MTEEYRQYLKSYYDWFYANYAPYSGHEWRERHKDGYVCAECGATCGSAKEMPSLTGTCNPRFAPKSWQPQA